MRSDIGPINCCDYGCNQSHNCPAHTKLYVQDGGARINTDMPKPTDGGDWVLFDKTSEAIFWAGTTALVVALVSLCASLTIFFFVCQEYFNDTSFN